MTALALDCVMTAGCHARVTYCQSETCSCSDYLEWKYNGTFEKSKEMAKHFGSFVYQYIAICKLNQVRPLKS